MKYTTLQITIYLIVHIVLIVPSYILVRNDIKKTTKNWTNGEKIFWLILAILFSPALFGTAMIIYPLKWISNTYSDYLNQPSNF